jgi:undecaprenyl-phosphate alpha-N-acetylglucosaminyl 1-phosphatetransferase
MFMIPQFLLLGAAVLTAALIWVFFDFAERWGLVDYANSERKTHAGAIPLIGGLAVFFCLFLFQLFAPIFPIAILIALFILVVIGIVDDKSDLPATPKLLFQCLAVGVMIFGGGAKIISLGTLPNGTELLLGWFSIPFTILCAVGLINAINMIDGMDGLAASLTVLALTYLVFVAGITGRTIDTSTLLAISILVGSLLSFLIFNFGFIPNKKIFLGDAGSMMLGLFLAFVLIQTSQRPPLTSTLPASIVPWALAVPVLDAISVMACRLRRGKSPMQADRTHLHHCLIDSGLSERLVLLFILAVSILLFACGILLGQSGGLYSGLAFVLTILVYVYLKNAVFVRLSTE